MAACAALGPEYLGHIDGGVLVVGRCCACPWDNWANHADWQFFCLARGFSRTLEVGFHRDVRQEDRGRVSARLVVHRARKAGVPGRRRRGRVGGPLGVDQLVILQRRFRRRERGLRLAIERPLVRGNGNRADDLGLGSLRPGIDPGARGFLIGSADRAVGIEAKKEGLRLGWATESTSRLSTCSNVAQIHCLELALLCATCIPTRPTFTGGDSAYPPPPAGLGN